MCLNVRNPSSQWVVTNNISPIKVDVDIVSLKSVECAHKASR